MPPVEYRLFSEDSAYRIGDDGSVWSCLEYVDRQGRKRGAQYVLSSKWKRLSPSIQASGYCKMFFRHGKARFVHRLVLEAFVGPCPDGMESRHLNGNQSDNCLTNLAWGTRHENSQDKKDHGTLPLGENVHNAVLTESIVLQVRHDFRHGKSFKELSEEYGFKRSTINNAVRGTTWGHLPGAIPFEDGSESKDEIYDPEYGFDLSLIMD